MSRRVRNWRSNQFSSSHRNRELNFYCFSRTRKKVFLKWRFPTISLQVKVLFYFMCFKNPCEFELNWFKLVWVSIHFIYSLLSSMKINCPVIFLNPRNKKKTLQLCGQHTGYGLLTKLVRSCWLDIGQVLFLRVYEPSGSRGHKQKKNEANIQPFWPNKLGYYVGKRTLLFVAGTACNLERERWSSWGANHSSANQITAQY